MPQPGPAADESHPRAVLRLAGRLFSGATARGLLALEALRLGTTDFYQFADLTAHKNRMQGNDFVQSNMYHRQICCFDCREVPSNQNESNLREKGNALIEQTIKDSDVAAHAFRFISRVEAEQSGIPNLARHAM